MLTWEFDEGQPQAGRHYPRDLAEFNRWFGTEANAVRYLTAVRFQHGISCPRCEAAITLPGGPRWWCGICRRWFTATTGTLPERTKVPLATWLVVAWHLVQTKIGVSALSVQRITGVDYATAWLLLHKMRAAMDQEERDKLSGEIELDETYVGGVGPGAGGRSRGKKSPVAAACEVVSPTAMGRVRLARLPDASALAIADFLEQNVEPGSVLISDRPLSGPHPRRAGVLCGRIESTWMCDLHPMGKRTVDLFDDPAWKTKTEAVHPVRPSQAALICTLTLVVLFMASTALPWFHSARRPRGRRSRTG